MLIDTFIEINDLYLLNLVTFTLDMIDYEKTHIDVSLIGNA